MTAARPDTRELLMAAAIRTFASNGYAGTSVQAILGPLGLSKPTLYYHFGSKEGLFRALLDHAHDEAFRRIDVVVRQEAPCPERLIRLAASLFQFATDHRDLLRLVLGSTFAAPGEIPDGVLDPARRQRNFLRVGDLIREGQARGAWDPGVDPVELTHGIFGAISHRIRMHFLQPEGPLDRACAERVVSLFLDGARRRGAPYAPSNASVSKNSARRLSDSRRGRRGGRPHRLPTTH